MIKSPKIFEATKTYLAQTSDPVTLEPLILPNKWGEYPLGLHLEILEDLYGELTMDEVSSLDFEP